MRPCQLISEHSESMQGVCVCVCVCVRACVRACILLLTTVIVGNESLWQKETLKIYRDTVLAREKKHLVNLLLAT